MSAEAAEWITTREAAERLGVIPRWVLHLGGVGRLTRRRVERGPTGMRGANGRRWFYRREEVERLAAERAQAAQRWEAVLRLREAERWRREGDRLVGWGDRATLPARMAMPCYRGQPGSPPPLECMPPAEELTAGWLTCREAADRLDVLPGRVRALVAAGLLPAYQRFPGRRGSPLRLPPFYVERLAEREERLERRARWQEAQESPRRLHTGWEKCGLPPYDPRQPGPLTERDYGEFYTTRQVALRLGVSAVAVLALRRGGWLHGIHKKPKKKWKILHQIPGERRGRQWWFFRKEEVEALQADPAYRRRHQAAIGGES